MLVYKGSTNYSSLIFAFYILAAYFLFKCPNKAPNFESLSSMLLYLFY